MFAIVTNSVQLDGSFTDHVPRTLPSLSTLPVDAITSGLKEYAENGGDEDLKSAIADVVAYIKGVSCNTNSSLPRLFVAEFIRVFVQYSTLKNCGATTPLLGIVGLSLPSYLASYVIGSCQTTEEFSANLLVTIATLTELGLLVQNQKLWPSSQATYRMSGVTKQQILTASRCCGLSFSVPLILDSNSLLAKGRKAELDKLTEFIKEHYNTNLVVEETKSEWALPTGAILDFPQPNSPNFPALLNGPMTALIQRLAVLIQGLKGVIFPSKSAVKVPFLSPFDGSYGDKALIARTRLIPSLGVPLFDDLLDFLCGATISLPTICSTVNFLLGVNGKSLVTLSGSSDHHRIEKFEFNALLRDFESKPVPVTINQNMVALHQHRYPTSSIYNITDIIRVHGPIDKVKAVRALYTALLSHPSTTLVFSFADGEIKSRFMSHQEVKMAAENHVKFYDAMSEEEAMKKTVVNTKEPFGVFNPSSLLRIYIMPISCTNTTLVQGTMHHLAGDGFSGFVIVPRFIQFYNAEDDFFIHNALFTREAKVHEIRHYNGRQIALASNASPMKDYWLSKFDSKEFSFDLKMLKSTPRVQRITFQGDEHVTVLEQSLWNDLAKKSTELGCTRFHLLAAAWSIVIARYSSQRNFNLGTAFHCRKEEWMDAVIFASNAMPVFVDMSPSTLKEFALSIKKRLDGIKNNEEYPASALIRDIVENKGLSSNLSNSPGQNTLFQIEMNYYHVPPLPKLSSKAAVQMKERIYPRYMQAGMTDLSAWFVTMNNSVILNLKYSTDVYELPLVKQIERDLLATLKCVSQVSAEASIESISVASSNEIWSQRRGKFIKGPFQPLSAKILNFASGESAHHVALIDDGVSLTYEQLSLVSHNIARRLRHHSNGEKAVVAVFLERSALYIAAMVGIMSAGCVYLPLNSADPIERIKGILEDSGAVLLLTDSKTAQKNEQLGRLTKLSLSLAELMKSSAEPVNLPVIRAMDPCYMIFTSGTTDKPKGVVIPHLAISNLATELAVKFGHIGTCLTLFEFSFDAHLHDITLSLSKGSTLVISKPSGNKDPKYILDLVKQHKVTAINMVPSMLVMILNYVDTDRSELSKCSSLQMIGCGGEALYFKLVERCQSTLKVRVINNYGPTETCVLCSYYDCGMAANLGSSADVVPIGNAIRNSEMLILGEDKAIVPVGVTGQLFIGGHCLAIGYANNPQQTQTKFIDHPYRPNVRLYASGDMAKYLPNGDIHFLGRSDTQIKLRGFRIECGEIEAAMLFNGLVKQSCVTVYKSEQRDTCLVGYAVIDPSVNDKTSLLSVIMDYLKTRLPHYMVPSRIVSVATLPLTSHGKIDLKRLADPWQCEIFNDKNSSASSAVLIPLSSAVEKTIANTFAEVLNIAADKIGAESNFFDMGGTSLHSFTVVANLKRQLNVKLELQQFFDNPTPAALSKLFDDQSKAQESINALERYNPRPLTHYECVKLKEATEMPAINIFLVHGAFRSSLVFKDMAARFPEYVTVYAFQDGMPLDARQTDDDQPTTMEHFADIYVQHVLKIQPSGIYHIAGYCFGGVLACEITNQLLQKGCNVCTLALIDSTAPSLVNARGLSEIKSPTIHRMISMEISMSLTDEDHIEVAEEIFQKCATSQEQKKALIDAFRAKIDEKTLIPFVERALRHFASSSGLMANYNFKPIRGRVTLFSATTPWALYNYYNPTKATDLGWTALHENLEVISTPGDHLTIVRAEEAIETVVSYLVGLLDKEGGHYLKLPSTRETLNLQSVIKWSNIEERVPNDCLNIAIDDSGPVNPLSALHRAVYYGLMAPSAHNMQPWKVYIDETNLSLIVCLNKGIATPFLKAVDSQSFYDRVDLGGFLFILKQLLQSYGFQLKEKYLAADPSLVIEPVLSIHIVPNTSSKPLTRQISVSNLPAATSSKPSASRQESTAKLPQEIRSSPVTLSRLQSKKWEGLITQRVTNRHYYSKRKVVPVRLLQQLKEDPFINQRFVRTLLINDYALIEMVAKWVQEVETAAMASSEVRTGVASNISFTPHNNHCLIPLDALALFPMQKVTAIEMSGMDQNTMETMNANRSIAIAFSQKIFHSGGLMLFLGTNDQPTDHLAYSLGASLIATMLKFTEHNVATHPWASAFLLSRLKGATLSPLAKRITKQLLQHTPDYWQRVDMLRALVPQIGPNETPLMMLRFGYPEDEVTVHSTRRPASQMVHVLKRGDALPADIASRL